MTGREDKTKNFSKQFVPKSIRDVFVKAVKQALKVSWMLLKIYIPISFLTAFLDQVGFLDLIEPVFEPFMKLLGLPGDAALVLLAAWVNNLFAAIAAASVIELTFRQLTIIAIITGFAHNLILETTVLVKLKMGRIGIAFARIVFSLLMGMLLNLIMPEVVHGVVMNPFAVAQDFTWTNLLLKTLTTAGQIIGLMFAVMLLYEFLIYWKQTQKIKNKLSFITRFFGMSVNALGAWLVGFFIGIAYGAGILFQMNKDHKLTHKDVCLLTISMCVVHALVEDTIFYVVVGANVWWILGVRLLALIIVMRLVSRGDFYKKITWIGLPKQLTIDS
jgi:hypothetical protein